MIQNNRINNLWPCPYLDPSSNVAFGYIRFLPNLAILKHRAIQTYLFSHPWQTLIVWYLVLPVLINLCLILYKNVGIGCPRIWSKDRALIHQSLGVLIRDHKVLQIVELHKVFVLVGVQEGRQFHEVLRNGRTGVQKVLDLRVVGGGGESEFGLMLGLNKVLRKLLFVLVEG